MSQICPSSSHQLVAAAMAFRRARRKFPKNYGLYCNHEETTKLENVESVSGNEDSNDQENLPFSSKKFSNGKSNRVEQKALWNDEYGENASNTENLLPTPIVCSCCRKRNECSAGDTLDVVPSKEYNGIEKKIEFSTSDRADSCDTKTMKGFITQSRNSNRGHTSYSHSGRRSPSGKLNSVNLLYDRDRGEVNNVKSCGSSEKRNCNAEGQDCCSGRKGWKSIARNSQCTFTKRKDTSVSSSASQNCDCQYAKHSTLDLLRPQKNYCRQNNHRCCHAHDHCHHCCGNDCVSNCSSKEKRLLSDTCLCSSNSKDHRSSSHRCHSKCDSTCKPDYCETDPEQISNVQEQNDEEVDDSVGTIYHKDSLCILVEKYKANKKCKQKLQFSETEPSEERFKDDCDKSFTSEATSQMDDAMSSKQGDKYSENGTCRFRDSRVSIQKTCRYGRNFRQEDCNQFKNLKSRLIKTGTCCSAKGTPWRHSF